MKKNESGNIPSVRAVDGKKNLSPKIEPLVSEVVGVLSVCVKKIKDAE